MPHLERFTVSLDVELLCAFDTHLAAGGYDNRSEAVRDLIRDHLVDHRTLTGPQIVAAMLTFTCDHNVSRVRDHLHEALAAAEDISRGVSQFALDRDHDAIVLALKGRSDRVQEIAATIQSMRGISNCRLLRMDKAG